MFFPDNVLAGPRHMVWNGYKPLNNSSTSIILCTHACNLPQNWTVLHPSWNLFPVTATPKAEFTSLGVKDSTKGWNKNDYQNILSFWPVLIFLYWIVMTLWHKTPLGWGKVGRETSDINEKNWAEYLLFLLHLIRLNINDYWWGL